MDFFRGYEIIIHTSYYVKQIPLFTFNNHFSEQIMQIAIVTGT